MILVGVPIFVKSVEHAFSCSLSVLIALHLNPQLLSSVLNLSKTFITHLATHGRKIYRFKFVSKLFSANLYMKKRSIFLLATSDIFQKH